MISSHRRRTTTLVEYRDKRGIGEGRSLPPPDIGLAENIRAVGDLKRIHPGCKAVVTDHRQVVDADGHRGILPAERIDGCQGCTRAGGIGAVGNLQVESILDVVTDQPQPSGPRVIELYLPVFPPVSSGVLREVEQETSVQWATYSPALCE